MANVLPRIDHIIIACKDVHLAAKDIYERFGLASYEGGKHQGWGTQNYITPLGAGYLELAAVFDEEVALQCDWGRLILNWPMPKDQPWALVTFCVETAEGVPAIVQRLKHDKANMVRARPDGTKLTWQVGAMHNFEEPNRKCKPFFINWDDPSIRPDKIPASHKVEPKGIEYIKFTGSAQDEKALHEWIGTQSLPLKFSDGPFDMKAVGIRTATGTVELT